jgi:diaminopimelate epimerase
VVEMKFWKMHGLGNDYIIIDNREGIIGEKEITYLAKTLCERRFSVGADGFLLVYDSSIADVKMRIFNADGTEAEMCGNGIRCFSKYCYENNIVKREELSIETLSGIKGTWLTIEEGEVKKVRVDMGLPVFERKALPMIGNGSCINEELGVDKEKFKVTCLSVGNPHCVIFVDDVKNFPVQEVGFKIENHRYFPNRINVEFVQVLNKGEISIRVWERGCGETLACGTGACASVVAGTVINKVNNKVTVHLLGGDLEIEFLGKIFMTGTVETVYEGRLFGRKKHG